MSEFIVSARKFRPADFVSVVGQSHITSTLKNAIERGQLAHAYLFCGPRGVGKTTCARIFAKSINCLNPNHGEACNECESCKSFNSGQSLNIHELDAASNNSVDDIRTLIEQVRIIPQLGRYSVFIIDEVHMLSSQAFNAFLKTLEEPPAHAVFILATTEKHKIIPTILSRCQIYDFNRIRVEDMVDYLKHIAAQQGVTYDDGALNIIAQKADGGMRDALSMFDKAVSFCGNELQMAQVARTLNVLDYDTYFSVVDSALKGDYTSLLLGFNDVISRGFTPQTFVGGLNSHLRDLLVARSPQTISLLECSGTLLERYRQQAELSPHELLFGAISILTEIDGKLRQSSNQRLLVELGLMKISALGQKKNNLTLSVDQIYELPPLEAAPIAVAQPQQAATPQDAPAPKPQPAPTPAPKPVQTPQPAQATEPTPAKLTRIEPKPAPILGSSLTELIMQGAEEVAAIKAPKQQAAIVIDPECEPKLIESKQSIQKYLELNRPRFVPTFEHMTVKGNTIHLKVATTELREEILRNKTELLMQIVKIGSIHGMVELDITVDETVTARRPIKIEDKIQYLTNKNPKLYELRTRLKLELQ